MGINIIDALLFENAATLEILNKVTFTVYTKWF